MQTWRRFTCRPKGFFRSEEMVEFNVSVFLRTVETERSLFILTLGGSNWKNICLAWLEEGVENSRWEGITSSQQTWGSRKLDYGQESVLTWTWLHVDKSTCRNRLDLLTLESKSQHHSCGPNGKSGVAGLKLSKNNWKVPWQCWTGIPDTAANPVVSDTSLIKASLSS